MPHLSKEEARAFIASAILVTLVTCIILIILKCSNRSNSDFQLTEKEIAEAEHFCKEIERRQAESADGSFMMTNNRQPFPFDPNHADSTTLIKVGLRHWQVCNLLKYRRKGGIWRSADDFKRLYGLTTEEFERLRPYIRITPADQRRNAPEYDDQKPIYYNSQTHLPYPKTDKFTEGTIISLSEADTTTLKHIPGIGSHYARKIVEYRERLGGYLSVSQLEEIEGLPPGVTRWFKLSENAPIHRTRINKASFKQLVRHPYLSYEQTKIIVNHIRRYGPIHSWSDLRLYKEFSDADFERLTPYFVFN